MGEYRSKYRDEYNDQRTPPNSNEHQSQLSTMEPMETYKQFISHQDESASPEVCQQRYDEYKIKYDTQL